MSKTIYQMAHLTADPGGAPDHPLTGDDLLHVFSAAGEAAAYRDRRVTLDEAREYFVAAETGSRVNADIELLQRLQSEAQQRSDYDRYLAERVSDEATARSQADSALSVRASTLESEVSRLQAAHLYSLATPTIVDGTPNALAFPATNTGSFMAAALITLVGGVTTTPGADYYQGVRIQLRKNGAEVRTVTHRWYYKMLNTYGGVSQSFVLPATPISVAQGDVFDVQVTCFNRYGFTSMAFEATELVLQGLT